MYKMPISGHPNANEGVIIAILLLFPLQWREKWNWSFADLLVMVFFLINAIGEFKNEDIAPARNVVFHNFFSSVAPYVLAKACLQRTSLSTAAAKKIVICATIVAILSFYEFRMASDLFEDVMHKFFPHVIPLATAFRYSFARIMGPWQHPITAGIIFLTAYRLARWLDWTNAWPGKVWFVPISKVHFCEICLIAGSIMTISRAPWIGALVGGVVVAIFRAKYRTYIAVAVITAVLLLGGPIYWAFNSYLSQSSSDETLQSALYRSRLIDEYIGIAEVHLTWGWGYLAVPTVRGARSVDNDYLWIALTSGIYELAVFVLILVWMPVQLSRFAWRRTRDDPSAALAYNMVAFYVLLAISLATVWLGAQTPALLFLVTGWGDGLVRTRGEGAAAPVAQAEPVRLRFERVMV
jgi:hypothetical protein